MQSKQTQAYKLSSSSISLMKECPRCFWLTKHKVWKRPSGIFPSLPSGMDRILKEHFDRFMERGELPPELCEDKQCKDFMLFNNKELLSIWRNNRKGIQWEDKNGNILSGAVDNILVNQKNKKLIILDYKTRGYPCKEDTHESYQNQLDIYNFLLRKNNYNTEDFAYLLFYVPKNVTATGDVVFDTELKKMKINVRNAGDLFDKALALLHGECPGESCEWCEGR